jgi:hypothetical protein
MKRALWMLPLPAAALAFALLSHRQPTPVEPAAAVTTPATGAATGTVTGPTWVATLPARNTPRAVVAPVAPPRSGPKPPTESRTALMESKVPVVPAMSIDHVGTPREQLLQERRGASESRQVQLDQLSDRTAAYLARREAERSHATGEERARIDRNIATIKRNQSFRARIVTTTGRVPVRPGARAN